MKKDTHKHRKRTRTSEKWKDERKKAKEILKKWIAPPLNAIVVWELLVQQQQPHQMKTRKAHSLYDLLANTLHYPLSYTVTLDMLKIEFFLVHCRLALVCFGFQKQTQNSIKKQPRIVRTAIRGEETNDDTTERDNKSRRFVEHGFTQCGSGTQKEPRLSEYYPICAKGEHSLASVCFCTPVFIAIRMTQSTRIIEVEQFAENERLKESHLRW